MNTLLKTLLSTSLLFVAGSALAHAVWIERDAKAVTLYYGEYDEAKRESSPGRLDDIGTPRVFVNNAAASGQKGANGWRYAATAKGVELRAEALESPVRDWRKQGIGIVKPLFYARYAGGPAAQVPAAELDLVPTGKTAEFQLFLKGQPLPGIKVVVVAPNGWIREVKSDAEGRIEADMPWRGVYVLEATHVVPESGEYNGVTYEARRMRSTLSYHQTKGPATFAPQPAVGMMVK
jgi:uncharacterized GH25 family protein